MWSPYAARFKTIVEIDYHIIEEFPKAGDIDIPDP